MMQAWMRIVACGTALTVRTKKPLDELQKDDVDALTYSTVQLGQKISGADYLESINKIHHFGRVLAALFQDFDVLITPTLAEPPAKNRTLSNPPTPDFTDFPHRRERRIPLLTLVPPFSTPPDNPPSPYRYIGTTITSP